MRTITVMEFDTLFSEAVLASDEDLPRIGQSPASFGGRTFHYGVEAPDRAGVYVLIFEYQNRLHPLYVGHGRSIRAAIGDVLSNHDALKRLAHGFYWTPVASEARFGEPVLATMSSTFASTAGDHRRSIAGRRTARVSLALPPMACRLPP